MRPALLLSIGCTALVALASASSPAHAGYYRDTNAGGTCHPANGAAASKFTYNNHYLANVGTTDQYVVCQFVMDDSSGAPWIQSSLGAGFFSPSGAGSVTCLAQTGRLIDGNAFVVAAAARSATFAGPNTSAFLYWEGGLGRMDDTDILTLSCKIPPGVKMGLITHTELQNGS